MRTRTTVWGGVLAAGLLWAGAAMAMPTGEALVNSCAACHGTHGDSAGPAMPTIAGLSRGYIIKSMKEYRSGARAGTVMGRIARGYNDQEIAAMATYLSKLPFPAHAQPYDPVKAAMGEKLHARFCAKCHGAHGRSRIDDAGVLAGQWGTYLHFAMDDIADEVRPMPRKMRVFFEHIYANHGEAAINDLVAYYNSQAKAGKK